MTLPKDYYGSKDVAGRKWNWITEQYETYPTVEANEGAGVGLGLCIIASLAVAAFNAALPFLTAAVFTVAIVGAGIATTYVVAKSIHHTARFLAKLDNDTLLKHGKRMLKSARRLATLYGISALALTSTTSSLLNIEATPAPLTSTSINENLNNTAPPKSAAPTKQQVSVTADILNIRSGPGTQNAVIAQALNGSCLFIEEGGIRNGFAKISGAQTATTPAFTGYVHTQYITETTTKNTCLPRLR